MLLRMYAFYDTKATVYGVPFFMINPATAMRAAIDLAQDNQTTVGRHPFDFILHELAVYDDTTGRIQAHPTPVDLGLVGAMLPQQQPLPLMQRDAAE